MSIFISLKKKSPCLSPIAVHFNVNLGFTPPTFLLYTSLPGIESDFFFVRVAQLKILFSVLRANRFLEIQKKKIIGTQLQKK